MTFTDYAESKGCKLLKDDLKFLRSQLDGLTKPQIQRILHEYIDTYVYAMEQCEIVVKRQNCGRYAANAWFRNNI